MYVKGFIIMKTVGQRLIFLMDEADMKQTDLADKIEISKQSLYKYTHDLCEPRSEVILRMAKALNTSADFIVGLTNNSKPHNVDNEKEASLKKENELLAKLNKLSAENRSKVEERIAVLLELQGR